MKNIFFPMNIVLSAFALLAFAQNVSAATNNRPNILWIIAEDMGTEALSRAGTPQVWTPNLDRLANEGVYYSRAYFGMVCSVSRSSFMTGMLAASLRPTGSSSEISMRPRTTSTAVRSRR